MQDNAIRFVFKIQYQLSILLSWDLVFIYETSWGTFKRYMMVFVFGSLLVEIEIWAGLYER